MLEQHSTGFREVLNNDAKSVISEAQDYDHLHQTTYSWHPPIIPILPRCPLWEEFTRAGIVSRTTSRQLHCLFGALMWEASVADLKRLFGWVSPPAKVLRLPDMTNRNLTTSANLECLLATYEIKLPREPLLYEASTDMGNVSDRETAGY